MNSSVQPLTLFLRRAIVRARISTVIHHALLVSLEIIAKFSTSPFSLRHVNNI